ncbi:MAG: ABC transporter permease [Acidobacteriota bacterium]
MATTTIERKPDSAALLLNGRDEARSAAGVESSGWTWGSEWLRDLRFAWRSLRRQPGFAVTAIIILALGIGANTAIFTLVNSVLLQPLPYAQPEQLVTVWDGAMFQRAGFDLVREQNQSFHQIAGYSSNQRVSLTGERGPARLQVSTVTPNLFSMLGVPAAAGRTFSAEEEQPGRGRVVVLSHDAHQRLFAGNAGTVGRSIKLDGVDHEVVGVMPQGFAFPSSKIDLWRPAIMDSSNFQLHWGGAGSLNAVGQLKDGVTANRAQQDLRRLMPAVRDGFPWPMSDDYGANATVVPLRDSLVGDSKSYLLLLWGAVGLVLLIACVNIANLLLVRAQGRQRELAVRAATGAPRSRLMRQLMTESVLLGLLGGLGGLVLAWAALQAMQLPGGLARANEVTLDGRVLAVALLLALVTSLLFGLLPALRASRVNLQSVLKEGGGSAGPGRKQKRLVASLVVSEIALTVVLAVAAGSLVRSFWMQTQVDPGFDSEQRVTAAVAPPEFRYTSDDQRRSVYGQFTDELRSLPGVESVGWTDRLPFTDVSYSSVFLIEGRPQPTGNDWPLADASSVIDEGYLQALGIPLKAGRTFQGSDRADAPGVAVVSESLAQRYWPSEEAVGKRIRLPSQEAWLTIVGVVGDIRENSLVEAPKSALYLPMAQQAVGPMTVVVKTAAEPEAALSALRQRIQAVDSDTPVSDLATMGARISASLSQPRLTMLLLGGFAALALLLASVGIYGVTATMVLQRRKEIALRMALGALPARVLRLVARQGLILAVIGLVVGLPVALALSQLMRSLLFGVEPADPLTLLVVVTLMVAAALAASYLPARRALRVEAAMALRAD